MHPERRKHVRILTIRNFAAALLVLVLALATANVISRIRAPRSGEYGRLTLDAKPVTVHRPEVVNEAEVPDITPGGPTASLVDETPAPPPAQQPAKPVVVAAVPPSHVMSDHVTIVGGRDGLRVETPQRDATPKLSGGIFRQ